MNVARLAHPRQRITHLILESGKPITVMVAPSGWGKTWAAAQAVEEWPGESVWITGQPDHADPNRFATDLWRQLASDGLVHPINSDARALEHLGHLIDPSQRLLLVVDEADKVHPDSIVALMRAALAHDAPFRLVLTMRRSRYPESNYPGIPTNSLNILTSVELAFTREEVIKLGGESTPALVRYDSHGGWPVAVATLHHQGDDQSGLTGLIRRALDTLPSDVRDLVTLLAPATVWSEALAERITGITPSDWQLTLVESGLPVHRGGLDELRPHNLVRETLLKELQRSPVAYRRSLLAAADYCVLRGDMRQAITHLLEAEAWHQLSRVLRRYVLELAADQRWQEIVDVTEGLPLNQLPMPQKAYVKHVTGTALLNVSRDLRALYAAGYANQVSVEPGSKADPTYLDAKGTHLLKRALSLDEDSQVAHVSLMTLAVLHDDVPNACAIARAGWELGPVDPVWHLYLAISLASLEAITNGFPAAGVFAREVRHSTRYGGNAGAVLAVRALEYHFRGLHDVSEIERVRAHLKTTAVDPLNEADRLYLAAVSEAMLQQERAHELLADLDAIRQRTTRLSPRSLQLIYRYRGVAAMMDARHDEGLASLKRAHQLAKHDPMVRSRTATLYLLALLRAGDLTQAERHVNELPEPRGASEHADRTLQRAALAHAQGRNDEALKHLAEVEEHLSGFMPLGRLVYATYYLSVLMATDQDATPALDHIEEVLAANPMSAQRLWWLNGKEELERSLMRRHPGATRTIMALSRSLLGQRSDDHVQPPTP